MVTSGGANFSVMTGSPRRKWYRPVSAETGGPCRANRVPGRTLGGTTAFQRTQVPGVAAYAVQRENLMQATKVRMLAINRNPLQTVIGQNEPTQDFLGIANVL